MVRLSTKMKAAVVFIGVCVCFACFLLPNHFTDAADSDPTVTDKVRDLIIYDLDLS